MPGCGMSEARYSSGIKLPRPAAEELVQERMAVMAPVHQRNRSGIILCGADPARVVSTGVCDQVTCQRCRAEVKRVADAVFAPLW